MKLPKTSVALVNSLHDLKSCKIVLGEILLQLYEQNKTNIGLVKLVATFSDDLLGRTENETSTNRTGS